MVKSLPEFDVVESREIHAGEAQAHHCRDNQPPPGALGPQDHLPSDNKPL